MSTVFLLSGILKGFPEVFNYGMIVFFEKNKLVY